MSINVIDKLPIFVLESFGHSGIDWTHSLLDGHEEIVIMPAFSFYRTIYKIEKINNVQLSRVNHQIIAEEFRKTFWLDNSYKVKRRQFLFSEMQSNQFKEEFKSYLDRSDEKNIIKKIFFGIHYSFCKVHKINIKTKKCIVIHEHVSWHYKKYSQIFNANHIVIFRNPKAVIGAGFFKIKKKNLIKKISAYQWDVVILDLFCAWKIINTHKSTSYILLNENMVKNLELEMKKLCKWMKINYSHKILKQTFLGNSWGGESVYLADDEILGEIPKNYYNPIEVEKRWRPNLKKKDILMIETLFYDVMKRFNYKLDFQKNIKKTFLGYFCYFCYYLHQDYYFFNKHLIIIRNFIRRMSLFFLKERINFLFKFK